MKVFISWSGDRSKCLAEALRKWLKQVINAVDPWLSVADIEKGARWRDDVATRLKTSDMGIICLTPGNLRSDWLLFEAGALSKAMDAAHVCPLLIDLEPSDVSGPLAQFQATRVTKDEIRALVRTINSTLPADVRRAEAELEEAFDVWWPNLEERLRLLPIESGPPEPKRSERDILEEILGLVREQNRATATDLPSHMLLRRAIRGGLMQLKSVAGVFVSNGPDDVSLLLAVQFDEVLNLPRTSFLLPILSSGDETVKLAQSLVRDYIRDKGQLRKGVRTDSFIDPFVDPFGPSISDDEVPF